ncbi:MAG: ctaA [Hyphomicrobiales bacterium]|nr:ctaA [Hyphomicrobiales bacterium]
MTSIGEATGVAKAFPARGNAGARTLGIRVWLWSVAALVFLMVIVGGATRLTESGLSITEWKVVTGVLPPLSEAAWLVEFEKYKQIPQFAQLFPTMDLAAFKTIFFWEWGHRLLGRVIGLAFALPLAWFWLRGRLTRDLKPKLLGLLALGGLQGAVGWWMVKSGLTGRVEVAQERLAIHLVLASITLTALVWLAVGLKPKAADVLGPSEARLRATGLALIVVTLAQIGLGGLVAGLRAGLTYNTWPLMDGHFIPPVENLARLSPVWANLVDNVTTVQFNHRMVAYALLALALWHAFDSARVAPGTATMRRARVVAGLVLCQAIIGITTLVLVVPLGIALLHQAFAMIVLIMAVVHGRRLADARA